MRSQPEVTIAREKQTPATDRAHSRQLALDMARLAADTRCHDVVVLDLEGISPVSDFFVLATGTSPRQMRSVAEDIEELAETRARKPLARAGYEGESWILVDFVDVVVHLFSDQARQFYDLENLWGDARRVEWKAAEAQTVRPAATTAAQKRRWKR